MTVYDASGTRPKTGKKKAVGGKPAASRSGSKRQSFLLVVAVLVVCGAAAASLLPTLFADSDATIPNELIGVWTTKAPHYADRSFEISSTTVLFRTGPGEADFTFHEIGEVRQDRDEQDIQYTITYSDGLKFLFTYETVENVIRLANQPEFFWSKVDERPSTIAAVGAVGAVAAEPPAPLENEPTRDAVADAEQPDLAEDTESRETELIREVFSYRGAARDPFVSLLRTADIRPFLQDLQVKSIMYDPRHPAMSVAVLRDTVAGKAYPVRVGDELGRMRVGDIVPGEVVLVVVEFGSERQVVLRQRGRKTL
ncbi:MAG: hypothetical protein JSW71_13125 [Gemmatimonadota bacterium]|nr:MAG: hypothetical protein JSW71_13125 [Gemmatimonadota bacterium]